DSRGRGAERGPGVHAVAQLRRAARHHGARDRSAQVGPRGGIQGRVRGIGEGGRQLVQAVGRVRGPGRVRLHRRLVRPGRGRARALWLLARRHDGQKFVEESLKDSNPDLRITGIRAARLVKMDMVKIAERMLNDSEPQVWRELCIAMYHEPTERALPVLVKLADKYDGQDRWYLEAFGIGAKWREPEVLEAWKKDH